MKTLSNVERVHQQKISVMISQINLRKLTATAQQSASFEEKWLEKFTEATASELSTWAN